MYSLFRIGNTSTWNLRQWGQVMEAYWTIVTGASLRPSAISGSSPDFMISSIEGFLITSRAPMDEAGSVENGLKGVSRVTGPVAASAVAGSGAAAARVSPSPVQPCSAAARSARRIGAGEMQRVRTGPRL